MKHRILPVVILIGALLSPDVRTVRASDPNPLQDSPRHSPVSTVAAPAGFGGPEPAGLSRQRARAFALRAQNIAPPAGSARTTLSIQQVAQNPRLGTNFANYTSNGGVTAYPGIRAVGASHDRVTFEMRRLMPSSGNWNDDVVRAYDRLITDALASNIQVLGVLIAPSNDARDPAVGGDFGIPSNLNLPWNHPNNRWGNWVFALVNRYKDRVKAWEMWNEPNLDGFWQGTPQQFAAFTRITHEAIKAADPNAVTVLGGIYRGVNIDRIARIMEGLRDLPNAAANGFYHDVIGIHPYDAGHCTNFDEVGFLDGTYFRPNVGAKLLWNTETGIRVRPEPLPGFATPAESASFVVTSYAYALHKDVRRFYYFRAIDDPDNPVEPWGLLDRNGVGRPSHAAFGTVAVNLPQSFEWSVRKFGQRSATDQVNAAGPVTRITFYNTPLGRVSVLYNITNTAQVYTLTGILPSARFVYPNGSEVSFSTNAASEHVLQMPAAPNFRWGQPECQVAGEPLIVIEGDVTPPTATLRTPPVSAVNTLTLTWTSADTTGGSGVWWHEVQASRDGGPWRLIGDEVVTNTFRFTADAAGVWRFRMRARDRAGNVPDWSAQQIVTSTITLTSQPPTPTPVPTATPVLTRRVFMPYVSR
jgi:hypothetical protein